MGSMCLQLGLLSASGADGSGGQRRTRLGWIAWVTWQSLCLPFSPSYQSHWRRLAESPAPSWRIRGNREHSVVF